MENKKSILETMSSFDLPSHDEIIQSIEKGEIKATDFTALSKKIIELLSPNEKSPKGKKFKEDIRELVLFEMGSDVEFISNLGYLFKQKEFGTKYNYGRNKYWSSLKIQEKELSQKRIKFEKVMKASGTKIGEEKPTYYFDCVDEDTGEVTSKQETLHPPIKTSTSSYEITKIY